MTEENEEMFALQYEGVGFHFLDHGVVVMSDGVQIADLTNVQADMLSRAIRGWLNPFSGDD